MIGLKYYINKHIFEELIKYRGKMNKDKPPPQIFQNSSLDNFIKFQWPWII